jgi:inner membrane transporter RhtA
MIERWRPVAMVIASSTSLQLGLAIATTAFAAAGPLGAVWVRSLVGGILLALYIRPTVRGLTQAQVVAVVGYALTVTGVSVFAYLALDHAPLGIVSAIIMLGPLAVSAWGQRGLLDILLVGIAAIGVAILSLAHGATGEIEPIGIAFALAAAAALGAYIVAGKEVGKRLEGLSGLALALLVAAVIQTPLGLAFARPGMWAPDALLALAAAGVLATLIPFALEMTALRSLSMATFGLLLAFEPGIASVVGFVVRGQSLTLEQILGIALVVVAAAATLGPRGWMRRIGRYNRELMADPRTQAFARVSLFNGLSAKEVAAIAASAEERDAVAGEVLTEQGAAGDEFFIVDSGEVEIRQDGRELRRLGPGDYLGEIALVFGGTRTATAVVAAPTHLFVLSKAAFDRMIKSQPRIEDKILTTVSERMRYR